MTPLERLGLEVVAFTLLGSRAQAASLCALLDAGGCAIPVEAVVTARQWKGEASCADGADLRNVAKTRICQVRDKLEDLGFPGVIRTFGHGGGYPATGYALPEPGRSAVLARLIEEAGA